MIILSIELSELNLEIILKVKQVRKQEPATLFILILIPVSKIKYSQKKFPIHRRCLQLKLPLFTWDKKSPSTKKYDIYVCSALNGSSTMNHRDATSVSLLQTSSSWDAAERKLFSWESHATRYPLTIAQHIYSRWSLAGFLSLQPAAEIGI